MRKRKPSSAPKKKQTRKGRAGVRVRKTTTWADPMSPVSKMSKRKRTQTSKKDWKKESCWWFC